MLETLLFGALLLGCLTGSHDGDGTGRSSSGEKPPKSRRNSSDSGSKDRRKKSVKADASVISPNSLRKRLSKPKEDTPAKKRRKKAGAKKLVSNQNRSRSTSVSTAKKGTRSKATPRSRERKQSPLTNEGKSNSKNLVKKKPNTSKNAASQVLDAKNERVAETKISETSARVDRNLAIAEIRTYIHRDILNDPVVKIPMHHIKGRTSYRQNEVSILKRYGYRVSRRDYISPWLRQQILMYALVADIDADLPFVDESYRKQWGPPLSMARYSRIRRHLLGLMRDRRQRYRHEWALSQWAIDEEWFRTHLFPIVKLVEP